MPVLRLPAVVVSSAVFVPSVLLCLCVSIAGAWGNVLIVPQFDKYMNAYKKDHPELTDLDLPRFEDMDHNNNGHINFHEVRKKERKTEDACVLIDSFWRKVQEVLCVSSRSPAFVFFFFVLFFAAWLLSVCAAFDRVFLPEIDVHVLLFFSKFGDPNKLARPPPCNKFKGSSPCSCCTCGMHLLPDERCVENGFSM